MRQLFSSLGRFPIPDSRFPTPNTGTDDRLDSTANIEVANDLHPSRLSARTEVIENAVHSAFIENAVVAKTPEIELEALELDAYVGWNVGDDDRAEIRCATLQQRELLRVTFHSPEWTERCE